MMARGPDTTSHWVILGLCLAILAAALSLQVPDDEHVRIPGLNVTLPETCYFKRLVGIGCPGCGLTRCFISALHGDFSRAWQFNPAGFPALLFVLGQLPYRILQIRRLRRGRAEWRPLTLSTVLGVTLILLLLTQWVWRLLVGAPV